MILDGLEKILSPLIYVLGSVFQLLLSVTGTAGFSIVLLSVLISIFTYPIGIWANKVELRNRLRKQKVDEEVSLAVQGLKGEAKFRATERIYETHKYHPISSIALGLPLFVMLPFLLSALFLFSNHPDLIDTRFLFISDLSQPDGIFGKVNLLPFVMTGITLVDARIRFGGDSGASIRFLIIAVVMFILVYNFAAGIVLYWTVSNVMALLWFLSRHFGSKASAS